MQPKQGAFTTPTSIVNLKNGKNIDVEVRQMFLKIQDADPLSLQLKILHVVQMILSLTCFVLIIYIPVQSFKVVRSLVKNEIFDMYNIKRIRRIGYALLVTCAFSVFGLYVMAAQANYLVDLENYEFVIGMTDQKLLILIFGLVILAFAEILKMALNMKEENDLTV